MKFLLFIAIILTSFNTIAQVEHNFDMGPDKTDCHNIPTQLDSLSSDETFLLIENATYRFKQEATFSRYRSPKSGKYFSCDGNKGFLILTMKDDTKDLYSDVPKSEWDALTNTNDPFSLIESGSYDRYKYKFSTR